MSEQQDEKAAAWEQYLDAWTRTIVETIDGYGQGFKGTAFEVSRADVLRMTHDVIRRELADAWAHRPGEGAPPEVVAFLAEHDETAKLRQQRDVAEGEFCTMQAEANRLRTEVESLKAQRDYLAAKLNNASGVTINISGAVDETTAKQLGELVASYNAMSEAPSVRNLDVMRVHKRDLFALLTREAHLAAQVTELQRANTALVEERRAYDRTAQVREFYAVIAPEQERLARPGIPSDNTVRFRIRLIGEEFCELLESTFSDVAAVQQIRMCLRWFDEHSQIHVNLPDFADALGDIDYVVEGARVCFGIDGRPIARAIHDANMAKQNGPRRASDGKRMKPEGWKPADVTGLLRAQGW